MGLFRSRVAAAILGAVVIGGASGGLGVLYAARNMPLNGGAASIAQAAGSTTSATITATGQGASGASPSAAATATVSQAPTAPTSTPTPRPTATPRPTPTPLTPGQTVTLRGSVGSVDTSSSSFTLNQRGGVTTTIAVSGTTQYSGSATGLSSLHSGWVATVTGVVQSDLSVAATSVNASPDN